MPPQMEFRDIYDKKGVRRFEYLQTRLEKLNIFKKGIVEKTEYMQTLNGVDGEAYELWLITTFSDQDYKKDTEYYGKEPEKDDYFFQYEVLYSV